MASTLKSPVYRYVVTGKPSSPVMYYGSTFTSKLAFSGFDLLALLDTLVKAMPGAVPAASDIEFGNIIRNDFVNFVKSGKPGLTAWQRFPENTALLSSRPDILKGVYHSAECAYFEENGLLNYSWQN